MIKLCDEFAGLPESMFSVRLNATNIAYKNQPFVLNWTQYVDDAPVAFLQKVYNNLTILTTENADLDEIREFINVVGADSVFATKDLGFEKCGFILKSKNQPCEKSHIKEIKAPDYKKVFYNLNGAFEGIDFEGFYLDFSHRVRHNTARVFADDNYNAVLTIGWETQDSAVVSAVSVLPDFQNQGLGRCLINSALNSLKNKTVYLYCEEQNIPFYEKCGFEICGEFSLHNTRGSNEKSI